MIDPRVLRDDPDRVRAAQAKRGLSGDVVDVALSADEERRASIADFERLRAEQKQLGKLIPQAAGEEKADLLARTRILAADVRTAEAAQSVADDDWREAIMSIPNLAKPTFSFVWRFFSFHSSWPFATSTSSFQCSFSTCAISCPST